jgi:hypothetical protein
MWDQAPFFNIKVEFGGSHQLPLRRLPIEFGGSHQIQPDSGIEHWWQILTRDMAES